MGKDWYPSKENEIPEWHSAFSAKCQASGTTFGLTAGDVNQARVDRICADLCVDFDLQVSTFAQAWQAWKVAVLYGDPNAAWSPPPAPPSLVLPDEDFLPGIRARTRRMANVIKADPDFSASVGEEFGILTPSGGPISTPQVLSALPLGDFKVKLRILKAGARVVAVDMRRGGGNWEQIGVAQTAFFVDSTAPALSGTPEQREYRVQTLKLNARVGSASAVFVAVAAP